MKPLAKNRSVIVWRKNYIKAEKRKFARTICEVIAEVYRDAEARGDPLNMTRLEEANDMAKRMQSKLKQYALKFGGATTLVITETGERKWLTKAQFRIAELKRQWRKA